MRVFASLVSTGVRRQPHGFMGHIFRAFAVCVACYTIWAAAFSTWDLVARTMVFLCMMLVLVFPMVGHGERANSDHPSIIDWILSASALACLLFFLFEVDTIAVRITLFDPLPIGYWIFGVMVLLLSLEAARRTVGMGLTSLVIALMVYNLGGHLLTGTLKHGLITPAHLLDIMVFTTDGLFGVPIQVTASYAFLFVLFGVLLERAGGGEFFFGLAASISGRKVGGPAKVAVFSSALFGTLSGSPTSDVMTTGSVTIPIMKRLGYPAVLASAVEVAASTGGSILPPVMGSAVFIMVEFTGISYVSIAIACIIPALLYYLGIYVQVHLRSVKLGLRGLPEDQIPRLLTTLKSGGTFIVPLVTLVTALGLGYSPTMVALFGAASVIVVWVLRWRTFSVGNLYDAVAQTAFNMVAVTGACAAAGMVIGGITMTGLAGKVSELLVLAGGSNMALTLVIAAALTIFLGMGMPTPAAYALAAALLAPTLINVFDLPVLQSHLFLLYFSVLSAMTPPVAVAAYAAAAISHANPMNIAVAACRLSLAAFVLPFALIYDPAILLQGTVLDILVSVITVALAVVLLSVAAEGFYRVKLPWWSRVICVAAAFCYLIPTTLSLLYGTVAMAIALLPLKPWRSVTTPAV
ncbi:MAG: TRAP transporter fused permease subunit [Pseudolabrys sp.]|nr:TRAP transporter fused permease subunit [Pseudolabrys sp.]MDP2295447.1 TRAP transporter fused permease subunit [Pseudolabrys sp.]